MHYNRESHFCSPSEKMDSHIL